MDETSQEVMSGFTLRLPTALKQQIEVRAKLQHRTRNAEIVHLLTQAIDASVAQDIELKESFNRPKKDRT